MKPDEAALLKAIQERFAVERLPYIRDIVADMGMNEKRAAYILEKWYDRRWLECGVSVFAGWLTDTGKAATPTVIEAR